MQDLPHRVENAPRNPLIWPSPLVAGGSFGIFAFFIAVLSPFLAFGTSVFFFFLYTWPFFLALLPVAVFTGMAISVWQQQKLFLTFVITLLVVGAGFWGVFYTFIGW